MANPESLRPLNPVAVGEIKIILQNSYLTGDERNTVDHPTPPPQEKPFTGIVVRGIFMAPQPELTPEQEKTRQEKEDQTRRGYR